MRAGARYLDLRFYKATIADAIRSGNEAVAGHYYIHHTVAGPESTVILNDIAAFLAAPGHEQEVIHPSVTWYEGDDEMGSASLQAFSITCGSISARTWRRGRTRRAEPAAERRRASPAPASARRRRSASSSRKALGWSSCATARPRRRTSGTRSSRNLRSPSRTCCRRDGDGGYPTPDDPQFPWVSDAQVASMLGRMSAERDQDVQEPVLALGIQFGLDDNGVAILRSINCPGDTSNVLGACPAPTATGTSSARCARSPPTPTR